MGRPANLVVNILGNSYDLQKALGAGGSAVSSFANVATGVGKAFAVVWTGAAVTLGTLAVGAFKSGVAFNSLNQTSLAAFKTILGSGEAAQKMMSDLDAFAMTSPFSKADFIAATQQMLGFGVASNKVIPILSAVQDAVAATGQSSSAIGEITNVLSKVTSSGKITADTLNQLGVRGIDAATLIGSQMGQTADQIRSSITAGTLDAAAAMDALTAGMAEKFGGAADNVKQTWEGATQSISARMRNLGSILAEPFVSKTGGGMAVTWVNQIAQILSDLKPVIQSVTDFVQAQFSGSFGVVTSILERVSGAIKGIDLSGVGGAITSLPAALAALTGGFAAISGGLLSSIPVIGPLLGGLSGPIGIVAAALVGLIAVSPDLQNVLGNTLQAIFSALKPVLPVIAASFSTLAGVLGDVFTAVAPLAVVIAQVLGQALATILPIIANLATQMLPLFTAAVLILGPAVQMVGDVFTALMEPIGEILSTLLPPLVQIIVLVMSAFQPLIPVVTQLIVALVGLISSALGPILPVLGKLLSALVPVLAPIIQLIGLFASLVGPILQVVTPVINLAAALAGALAGAIGKILTGGLNLMGPAFQAIANAIGFVVSAVQNLIHWFSQLRLPSFLTGGLGGLLGFSYPGGYQEAYGTRGPMSPMSYFRRFDTYAPNFRSAPANRPAVRPINITVQTVGSGDATARAIRRELVALDRRERGVVLGAIL